MFKPGDCVLVNETVDRGRERELIHHDGVVVEDPRGPKVRFLTASGGVVRVPVEVDLHEVDTLCRKGQRGIRFYRPEQLILQPDPIAAAIRGR